MEQRPPIPVRERARRAMRAELAMLAQDLFAAKGYEQTTVEDLVAAAGISKRTFFRYFTSKEDLVLGKHDVWAEKLIEAFDTRPDDEPIWDSLRRAFDVIVDYFGDEAGASRTLAMEKVIHGNPALSAGELERVSRVQGQPPSSSVSASGNAPRPIPARQSSPVPRCPASSPPRTYGSPVIRSARSPKYSTRPWRLSSPH